MRRRSDRSKSHGQAAIELALMSPWILLLFMAVFTIVVWRMNAAFWKDIK